MVGGFLHQYNWPPYNWYIVESVIKHQNFNRQMLI